MKVREMSVRSFIRYYRKYWYMYPKHMREDILSDPNYLFKVGHNENGDFLIELGYKTDEWFLER